mmetsp:Transcript_18585/g.40051  ORF Transcript_18585/g.40051 Transcript_18585/m.40051 type:complete len:286 (-) Transcript_18585:1137-1994(-)
MSPSWKELRSHFGSCGLWASPSSFFQRPFSHGLRIVRTIFIKSTATLLDWLPNQNWHAHRQLSHGNSARFLLLYPVYPFCIYSRIKARLPSNLQYRGDLGSGGGTAYFNCPIVAAAINCTSIVPHLCGLLTFASMLGFWLGCKHPLPSAYHAPSGLLANSSSGSDSLVGGSKLVTTPRAAFLETIADGSLGGSLDNGLLAGSSPSGSLGGSLNGSLASSSRGGSLAHGSPTGRSSDYGGLPGGGSLGGSLDSSLDSSPADGSIAGSSLSSGSALADGLLGGGSLA